VEARGSRWADVEPDDLFPTCSRRGCHERARWRPFVYVPTRRISPEEQQIRWIWPAEPIERGIVVVPLPMLVCDKHKLSRRVEEQLTRSRRFRRLLAGNLAARGPDWTVTIDHAWVIHERIEDDRARG
jgi:hypothetical protein